MQKKIVCKICGAENEFRNERSRLTCFNCENDLDMSSAISIVKNLMTEQDEINLKRRVNIVRTINWFIWAVMALLAITRWKASYPKELLEHLMIATLGILIVIGAYIDSKKGVSYMGAVFGHITKRNDSFESWIFYNYLIGILFFMSGIVLLVWKQ